MNKNLLSYLSAMAGWTGGAMIFGTNLTWINTIGWIIFIGGFGILQFMFCKNDVKGRQHE